MLLQGGSDQKLVSGEGKQESGVNSQRIIV